MVTSLQNLGFRVLSSGFRVDESGCEFLDLGFGLYNLGLGFKLCVYCTGLGFRVYDFRFSVLGEGCIIYVV